jgi:protein OPY2
LVRGRHLTIYLNRRSCNTCGSNQCLSNGATKAASSSSSSLSAGAAAGAVVASVLLFLAVLFVFLWYRRRQRRQYPATILDEKPEKPARAEDVLQRSDPNERAVPSEMPTFRMYTDSSMSSLSLPAESNTSSYAATHGHQHGPSQNQSPPMAGIPSDHRLSIGTHPNLISAAFTPAVPSLAGLESSSATPDISRDYPVLSGDSHAGLAHSPHSALHPEHQYGRQIYPDHRHSYNTTTTFASDLTGEVPTVVTASHGAVKQVIGVARAEFVRTPKPSLSSMHPSLHFNRLSGTKLTFGIASTSKIPLPPLPGDDGCVDTEVERATQDADPFQDRESPSPDSNRGSPAPLARHSLTPSAATFGDSGEQRWPKIVWKPKWGRASLVDSGTDPGSVSTSGGSSSPSPHRSSKHSSLSQSLLQALPSDGPRTSPSTSSGPSRSQSTTAFPLSGRRDTLTVPSSQLEFQPRQTVEEINPSCLSVISSTSSLAESLISAFPFVPPSPIGSLTSTRTPPRSPLAQQTFRGSYATDKRSSSNSNSGISASLTAPSTDGQIPSTPSSASRVGSDSAPSSSLATRQRTSLGSDRSSYPLFLNRRVDKSRLSRDEL